MPNPRYFISDFVDIQRKSFFELLEKGIIEEFSKRNPITSLKKDIELFFYPEYYKLTIPEYSPRQAIIKSKSYTSKLYLPVQLTYKKSNLIRLKWAYVGNLPLMTKRGHFILNGAARVIVNQIIRSPGIYYQEKLHETFSQKWSQKPEVSYKRYYADLICLRGTWLRLEIDKDKNIWAQTKKGPKIPVFWFLIAMGLSERVIFNSVLEPNRLVQNLGNVDEFNIKKQYLATTCKAYGKKTVAKTSISFSPTPSTSCAVQPSTAQLVEGCTAQLVEGKFKSSTQSGEHNPKTMQPGNIQKNNYCYVKNPPSAWKEIFALLQKKNYIRTPANTFDLPSIAEGKTTQPSTAQLVEGWMQSKKEGNREITPMQVQTLVEPRSNTINSTIKGIKTNGQQIKQSQTIPIELNLQSTAIESKIKTSKKTESFQAYSEQGRKWLFSKFMNPRAYDLGKQGRSAFNRKLGLKIDERQLTLTAQDLLYATDYLIKVEKGLRNLDDIDHLKNRRVRTSGELIQIQIGIALVRLEKAIRDKINKTAIQFNVIGLQSININKKAASLFVYGSHTQNNNVVLNKKTKVDNINKKNMGTIDKKEIRPKNNAALSKIGTKIKTLTVSNLINNKAFNSALREFFGTSPLSQFMDQINPLAEITHKRRLSSMGPGGVTRDTATLAIRGIHPTHYGRICPIETPEGKNTGLVNSMTAYARVNPLGMLESPFYKVYKGIVLKASGMFFLSAEQEEKTKLAAADLFVTPIGFLPNTNIPVRIGENFTKIHRNNVEYIGVSPIQMISIATSLIPFLEHDDANRALMGSNMQRQAVPLIRPERPIVGTGLEPRAVSDSGHVIQSKFSGVITYVSAEKIIVTTFRKELIK